MLKKRAFVIFACLIGSLLTLVSLNVSAKTEFDSADTKKPLIVAKLETKIDVSPIDMVYDPHQNVIWATHFPRSPTHTKHLVAIDPETGETKASISTGPGTRKLALSEDGTVMYIGYQSVSKDSAKIRKINLISETVEVDIPLNIEPLGGKCSRLSAEEFVIFKDNPHSFAVSINCDYSEGEYLAIFDNDVVRPNILGLFNPATPFHLNFKELEPSEVITKLYASNSGSTASWLDSIEVSDDGVRFLDRAEGLVEGFAEMAFYAGHIYSSYGHKSDPVKRETVGTYPLKQTEGQRPTKGPFAINPNTNQIVYAHSIWDEPVALDVFDLDSMEVLERISLESFVPTRVSGYQTESYDLIYLKDNRFALAAGSAFSDGKIYVFELVELDNRTYLPSMFNRYCSQPYQDDFSDPNSGWRVEENDLVLHRYLFGEYNIFHERGDQWTISSRGDFWNQSRFVEIDGKVEHKEGVWGLFFGLNADGSEIYTFELLPDDKRFVVLRFTSSNGWELVTSAVRDEILPSPQWNTLSLKQSNGHLQLQINNVDVYHMNQQEGLIGLTGGSFAANTDIRYDNYTFVDETCPYPNQQRISALELNPTFIKEKPNIQDLLDELVQEPASNN